MKDSLILIGGGGHCKSCIDVIEQEDAWLIKGILDPALEVGGSILGYPILGGDEKIGELAAEHLFLLGVGQIKSPEPRITLAGRLREAGARIVAVVISPRAYVSPHATIGVGTIVMPGATINAGAMVGQHCIINSHALVEHDATIGDYCHIATGVILNGGVRVADGGFIGSGSVVREYVTIGPRAFIAAGNTVYRDLP